MPSRARSVALLYASWRLITPSTAVFIAINPNEFYARRTTFAAGSPVHFFRVEQPVKTVAGFFLVLF
jgi:hypothetical protein